jgi:tetratricopeptide (TPR) repeat protein
LGRVELLEQKAQAAPAATQAEDGSFFDLAAELDDALFEPQAAVLEDKPEETDGHSLEDLVAAFKKGVEQQVSAEDYETHYNLAIAYKEMGLTDEAIGEFQFASKSPGFFLKCCSMLGICFREKGMNALAAKWYRKGLESAGAGSEEEALGLRYDLALLHEEGGEFAQALELLTEVFGVNAHYRDVADRIRQLGERGQGGQT